MKKTPRMTSESRPKPWPLGRRPSAVAALAKNQMPTNIIIIQRIFILIASGDLAASFRLTN